VWELVGEPVIQALFFGLLSAVSLPLGAITARFWIPRDRVIAVFMAFGAGALLSALTIDLVGEALHRGEFPALALGALGGGLLFVALNQALNAKGGFLRKSATTTRYLKRLKVRRLQGLFRRLSEIPFFNQLPAEEIAALVPAIMHRSYAAGTTIIRQGEPGDSLFVVESGRVAIEDFIRGEHIATLGPGDVFGEMSLVTGEPRSATAVAESATTVWLLLKEDFDRLISNSPHLATAVAELTSKRISNLKERRIIPEEQARQWYSKARRNVDEDLLTPTTTEVREAASEHGGAAIAIWLGILLDGIPESLVIGASLVHSSVSLSLIAGLFLSNYPEALSSSAAMRSANHRFSTILLMWTSLLVITGLGAMAGNVFFVGASPALFTVVEGLAAGAMLTMIAETMLPEAYHKGGSITGLSTLCGFLTALLFKTVG
jgi:CRP-like cAMP-binding protein